MKNVFVKTKNVKRLVALLDEVQKLPPNIPKLALFYCTTNKIKYP